MLCPGLQTSARAPFLLAKNLPRGPCAATLDACAALGYETGMNEELDHKAHQARRKAEREARRKAELKANMARRKAQARGRSVDGGAGLIEDSDGGAMPPDNNM